jgi:uncharacterized UBP type Zn finger protein
MNDKQNKIVKLSSIDKTFKSQENKTFIHIFDLLLNLVHDEETLEKLFDSNFTQINNLCTVSGKYSNDTDRKIIGEKIVGLRNLGATCYMNAMLQQFFMIPAFRYNIIQAIDGKEEVFSDQKNIDDNLLHQFQKMFTFLELSNRQAFHTGDFCYTYKDFEVLYFLN